MFRELVGSSSISLYYYSYISYIGPTEYKEKRYAAWQLSGVLPFPLLFCISYMTHVVTVLAPEVTIQSTVVDWGGQDMYNVMRHRGLYKHSVLFFFTYHLLGPADWCGRSRCGTSKWQRKRICGSKAFRITLWPQILTRVLRVRAHFFYFFLGRPT